MLLLLLFSMHWESRSEAALTYWVLHILHLITICYYYYYSPCTGNPVPKQHCKKVEQLRTSPAELPVPTHRPSSPTEIGPPQGRGGVDGREGFIWVSRMWRFPKSWGTPRYHPFVGYHPLLIQAWGELSMKQTNQLLQNSRWKPPQALPPISAPLDSAGAVWPGVFCVDHEDRD